VSGEGLMFMRKDKLVICPSIGGEDSSDELEKREGGKRDSYSSPAERLCNCHCVRRRKCRRRQYLIFNLGKKKINRP